MKEQDRKDSIVTLGQHLRAERELRGIELDEVSRVTRIRVAYLQYLEDDRLVDLPGDVYTRGYVRAYARFLGIDAERCIELCRRQSPDHALAPAAAYDGSFGGGTGGLTVRSLPVLADNGTDTTAATPPAGGTAMGSARPAGRSRIGLALAIVMLIFGALLITGVYYVNRTATPGPDSNNKPPAAKNDKNTDFFVDS